MTKKFQLQIPEPCHESWDNMTPADKGRFCGSCQKTVIDFTRMSDAQLIAFFKKPATGSTCGRFYGDQLNRDYEIPRKRLPWIKLLFQIVIPALLFTSKAKSQVQIRTGDTTYVEPGKGDMDLIRLGKPAIDTSRIKKISGKITDDKGKPIPYATVMVKGTKTGAMAKEDGSFIINPYLSGSTATLQFSSVGFASKEILIDTSGSLSICSAVRLTELRGYLGGLVVVSKKPKKTKDRSSLFQRVLKDSIFKSFRVYPNPVLSGGNLTIELNKSVAGEYRVELMNQNGQLVYTTSLSFASKNHLNVISIPKNVAGAYFLRLINRNTGKSQVEKIIIQ